MTAPLVLALLLGGGQPAAPAADPRSIAARALALQRDGKLEEAAVEYERLLRLVPGSWEARSNLGVVHAGLGRYDAAIAEYRAALALRPSAVAVRHNLAVALYKAARVGEAAGELEAVLKAQPGHEAATLLLADCRLLLGEWKSVIALLEPVLEREPDNRAVLYMLGTALVRDRQYERGQRVIDRILRQGDSAESHLLLAIASREANDDIAAEKALRRALELDPRLPTANGILGDVLVRMGEGTAALEFLRRELEVNSNHFESHVLLGLLLRQDGRNAEAMGHLERALALRPGDPGVRYQMALVEIARSELERARVALTDLVAERPDFSEAHVSLATVCYRLGRREEGDRHQAIVRRLRQEEAARQDAEKARRRQEAPPR